MHQNRALVGVRLTYKDAAHEFEFLLPHFTRSWNRLIKTHLVDTMLLYIWRYDGRYPSSWNWSHVCSSIGNDRVSLPKSSIHFRNGQVWTKPYFKTNSSFYWVSSFLTWLLSINFIDFDNRTSFSKSYFIGWMLSSRWISIDIYLISIAYWFDS